MNLKDLMAMLQGQTVQPSTVRPDYGLTGAMISQQRSPYERTMAPGEQRSAGDLQDMLGEVILAAGAGASPVAGPRGMELVRAARPRPNDSVTLFHGTTRENAAKIEKGGFAEGGSNPYSGTPRGALGGIYLAPSRADARNYSPDGTVVEVRVKKALLKPDNTDVQYRSTEESLYRPRGGMHGAARVDYGSPVEVVKVHREAKPTEFWAVANSFTKVAPDGARLGPYKSVNEALKEARAAGWKEFGVE